MLWLYSLAEPYSWRPYKTTYRYTVAEQQNERMLFYIQFEPAVCCLDCLCNVINRTSWASRLAMQKLDWCTRTVKIYVYIHVAGTNFGVEHVWLLIYRLRDTINRDISVTFESRLPYLMGPVLYIYTVLAITNKFQFDSCVQSILSCTSLTSNLSFLLISTRIEPQQVLVYTRVCQWNKAMVAMNRMQRKLRHGE